jgi:hypothetical protein
MTLKFETNLWWFVEIYIRLDEDGNEKYAFWGFGWI